MLACQMPKKKRREPIDYPEGLGGREICNLKSAEGRRIYWERTYLMEILQSFCCAICGKWMHRGEATFDHEAGRAAGKQDDRIEVDGKRKNAALCVACQGLKGSKRYKWQGGKYLPVTKFQEVA